MKAMIACTMLRPRMLSSLVVFVLAVLPSLVGGTITAVAANANNDACVVQRILEAIDILEGASVEANTNTNAAAGIASESTRRAIAILSSITDDIMLKEDLEVKQQDRRRLEEDGYDDDDYFQYKEYTNVAVTYNDGNETVVTVGEGVTVIIEHSSYYFIFNLLMIVACVTMGALMSGLLMGVMTLDPLILGIKARTAETEGERRQARALTPFVQNKNLVLVSVVLVNCGVNEALPVFIERILENTFYAIVLSVTLVVFAGEIIPAAYFMGSDQIRSASNLIPLLRLVIVVTSPISYPLSHVMDKYFHEGDERSTFKRGEISALVRIQHEERLAWKLRKKVVLEEKSVLSQDYSRHCNLLEPLECIMNEPQVFAMCKPDESGGSPTHEGGNQEIDDDDITKMEGVLALKTKKVKQAYTPLSSVISITSDTILDEDKIVELYSHGYSRIPVYESHANEKDAPGIVGVLLTKQLILFNKEDRRRVSTLSLYQPPAISPETSIAEALNIFQAGNQKASNMALVCVRPELATAALKKKKPIPSEAGVLGIITLENLLEVLIQEQIYDEKDKKYNRSLERATWALAKWKVFTLRRRLQREDSSEGEDEFGYAKMREIV
jgi:metal transporter CNNM